MTLRSGTFGPRHEAPTLHNKGKQMKKYILTASAIAFGAAIFLAAPAYAGEDCLGLSIGPGCIGIDGDSDHQYRRSDMMPAHAHHYVAPDGGQYYYDEDSYYYRNGDHD